MKGNHIKQMRVKVKENPLQFIVILSCFIILAFLICAGGVYQSARTRRISTEQGTVLLEEAGAFRANMEQEIKTLSEQLSEKNTNLTESELILKELAKEFESSLDTYSMQQISATTESLETIRESIKNSELLITQIQDGLQDNSENTKTLVADQMNELTNQLEEIDKRYVTSAEDLKSLIDHLGQDQSKAAEEMTEKLGEVESNLTANSKTQVTESVKEIKDAFEKKTDDMGDRLSNQYEELNSNIASNYKDLGDQYDLLSSDLGNQFNTLNNELNVKYDGLNSNMAENYTHLQGQMSEFQQTLISLGNGNEAMQAYLEQQFGSVDGKLSQVFQSVSSGKSMLASALLTKGVEIPQDASFNQIKEGILAIPQTIYLGTETQYLPGRISFDYHNHVDGAGNATGGAATLGGSGGCYTKPAYHVHGDSCYRTYSYVAYRYEPIPWEWTNAHTHGNSYTGVPDNCKTCSFCGAHEIYGGHYDHVKEYEYLATGRELTCTKIEGQTIDAYTIGCGLSEGQIVGAHIVY